MTVDEQPRSPRELLGQRVRQRREDLGLSQPAAADRAGINRDTWRNMENGSRDIRSYNHRAVERALQWQPGSVEAILAGGEPQPLGEQERIPLPAEVRRWLAIMADPNVPDRTKERMRQQMRLWTDQIEADESTPAAGHTPPRRVAS